MILKSVKTEHTDVQTGMVLKRITTSEWEHLNRKMAINNSLFTCEQERIKFKKPLLESPFQIQHINFNKKKGIWEFDSIGPSKAHAIKQNRFYLVFHK